MYVCARKCVCASPLPRAQNPPATMGHSELLSWCRSRRCVGPHQAPGTRRRRQQCSSARPGMPHCHAALRVRARARASDVPRPGCIARRHWAGSRPQLRAMSRGRGCAWSSTDARGASVPPRSCAARTAAQAQPAASAAMATARLRTCAAHGACRRSAGTTHSWDHAFPTSAIALAGRTQPLRRTVAALPMSPE